MGLFLAGCAYQVESLPAYNASAQSSSPTKEQGLPAIDAPQGKAEAPITRGDEATPPDKIKRSEWVQLFISGFVALVVFWQAWIYNEQRKMADRQIWQTYLAERAYIGLTSLEVSDLRPNQQPYFQVRLINGGKTPAWNLSMQIHWNIGVLPIASAWNPDYGTSHTFVAAGQSHKGRQRLEVRLSEENVRVLEDDSMQFFATVQCRYVDFKGEPREASFPGVYDRSKGNFVWHKEKNSPNSN